MASAPLQDASSRAGSYRALGSGAKINADPTAGLTTQEAKTLLLEHGPNELEAAAKEPFISILIAQMMNLIFLLTSVASFICYATGDNVKGTFLVCLVVIVCFVNALGEYTGQDAGSALKDMDAKEALVFRDGSSEAKQVPVAEIVPGDVVEIRSGSVVPADMEIIVCNDVQVDEGTLTGEAKEVHKFTKANVPNESGEEKLTKAYCLYKSTCVVSGKGKGIVLATGMKTQVGLIAKRLKDPDENDKGRTKDGDVKVDKAMREIRLNPLQVSINRLGTLIAICCGIVIFIGTVAGYFLGYQNVPPECSQTDRACLAYGSAVRGLLMAIAIIPHGLPLVVMIMLRVGSQLMYAKNALVMKQSAVDYLGAAQVICSDKTGTLTVGVMAVKKFVGILRSDRTSQGQGVNVSFYPLEGLNPRGGVFPSSKLRAEDEQLLDSGAAQPDLLPGVPNLADSRKEAPNEFGSAALITHVSLAAAFVHCHSCKILPPPGGGEKWRADGSTSEAALKVAAWKGSNGRLVDDQMPGRKLKEYIAMEADLEVPFNSDRKMAATVHRLPTIGRSLGEEEGRYKLHFKPEHTHFAIVKGAPDRIIPKLSALLTVKDGALSIAEGTPTSDELAQIKKTNDDLGAEALRALLMAVRPLSAADVSALQAASASADERLAILLDERRPGPLTFLGFWGIYDPPRASVAGSIARAHAAFIRVVMITGDQMPTAVAIAKKVGILGDSGDGKIHARRCKDLHHSEPDIIKRRTSQALTCEVSRMELKRQRTLSVHDMKTEEDSHEKEYLDTEELGRMTLETNVWSRAEPTDKYTIVESIKSHNLKVAMTGDGVNDAPALKRADIGVAMGIAGTAVTKKAASMVLLDDNFSTILEAVGEGRKIYGNVQKYVIFNLCVKGSECFVCMIAIFGNLPLPICGVPQLVNLVVTHIVPPIALAWEDAEEYTMTIPPRKTDKDLVIDRVFMLYRWVPFLVCYALVISPSMCFYMWLQVGFFDVGSIVGSHEAHAVENGQAACQIAGQLSPNGDFIADQVPFHCKCYARKSYWDSEAIVTEQWGLVDGSGVAMDRWTGSTGDAYHQRNTPWKNGREAFLQECLDGPGNKRLCWKDSSKPKPLLGADANCAAFGARKADTMAYVSIQIGEILSLATFRTDGFVGFARFSKHYSAMLVFNFFVLFIVLTVPYVTQLLGFQPLQTDYFLLALIAPLVLVTLSEVTKIEFRNRLAKKHDQLREEESDCHEADVGILKHKEP